MNQNENPSSSGNDHSTTPSHEEISARALEIWDEYGRPENRDDEIWYEAERALRKSKLGSPSSEGDGKIPSPEDVSSRNNSEFESSSAPSPSLGRNKTRKNTGAKNRTLDALQENVDESTVRMNSDPAARRRSS